MTLITGTMNDVSGTPDDTAWVFYSPLRESDDGDSIITTTRVHKAPVAGELSIDLDPGFVVIEYKHRTYQVTVPETGPVDIWDLIAASVVFPPGTSAEAVAAAVEAYLASLSVGAVGRDVLESITQADAWVALGPVPVGNLPDLALVAFKGHKANQAAMLATTGESGDWVIRDDSTTVWVVTGTPTTSLGSWTQWPYPAATWAALPDKPDIAGMITAAVNANGVVDLRLWSAIRNGQWQTSLGAHYTSGSFTMTNDIVAFTAADVGKIVIVNENPVSAGIFTRWMATILSVNGSGVATLDAAAPSSAVSQRIQWGFDCTTAINTALAAVAAGGVREAYLPGRYRVTQIVVPSGVMLHGSGWGSYGGLGLTSPVNTLITQLPGAEKDLMVFSGGSFDTGVTWIGPVAVTHMLLQGPEVNVRGHTPTVGNGFALRAVDGTPLVPLDGCEFKWLHSHNFPENGFKIAGGVPLTIDNCRAFYNGQYGFDYNAATINSTQMVHLMNCTADGNVLGAVRFRNTGPWGPIAITAFKSEANTSAYYGAFTGWDAVSGWAGVGDVQMSALTFEDCDQTPVIINGVSHIYGLSPKGPGPAILIKSATTKVPRITYNAVAVRIQGSETGSIADAVTLRDMIPTPDVDIPRAIVSGRYPSDTTRLTVTSAVTLGSTGNHVVFIGPSGAPTLPTAVGNTYTYLVNNDDTVNHTLAAQAGETIMGASSITLAPDESVTLSAKGTNWKVF